VGPSIVLVHGLGVSADYWYRNGPALAAAGRRVLAPDLPGFGRTKGPADGLTVEEQASFLGEWAAALEVGPAVYVGHSLSCQVALELAAARPDLVRGLALAAPTGDPRGNRLLRQGWGLVLDAPREPLRLVVEIARAYLQAGPARVWRTWLKGTRETPLPLLPRIEAPGVVIVGTRDPVVPRDFASTLTAGLPEGRMIWVEGAAHGVVFSHPSETNAAILSL
jgi:2-hydroxy-6-oxonona-2,4-dienedioate hydrolase